MLFIYSALVGEYAGIEGWFKNNAWIWFGVLSTSIWADSDKFCSPSGFCSG
jgi:hypothetical protein